MKRKVKPRKLILKSQDGYNAYALHKGKYIKLNKRPLSKANAQNRASYVVDNSTSAKGKIKRIGKFAKLDKITNKEISANSKIKARRYKFVKGKKVPIKNMIIERRGKPRINTIGEKKGLSAKKLSQQLNRKKRKTKRRKK